MRKHAAHWSRLQQHNMHVPHRAPPTPSKRSHTLQFQLKAHPRPLLSRRLALAYLKPGFPSVSVRCSSKAALYATLHSCCLPTSSNDMCALFLQHTADLGLHHHAAVTGADVERLLQVTASGHTLLARRAHTAMLLAHIHRAQSGNSWYPRCFIATTCIAF